MNAMWNDVSDGSDTSTFLLTGSTVFEYYENTLTGQIRYTDTRLADAGFQALAYKNVPILWDPQIGNTDEIYFINTRWLKLKMNAGSDFVSSDFTKPANQAARSAQILVMATLCSNNRRRLGTIDGITAPA